MARYLLDTNTVIFIASDPDMLSRDVEAIIKDYDSVLCVSVETLRELIVNFNNNGIASRIWETSNEIIDVLINEYGIVVLPTKTEHIETYSNLLLNISQGHKDPSDHIIISHAITENLPLISSDTRFPFYKNQGLDLIFNDKKTT